MTQQRACFLICSSLRWEEVVLTTFPLREELSGSGNPAFSLQHLRHLQSFRVSSFELPGFYSVSKWMKEVFGRSTQLPVRTLLPGITSTSHWTGADQVASGESYLPASSLYKLQKCTQIHRSCKTAGAVLNKRPEVSSAQVRRGPLWRLLVMPDDSPASKCPASIGWSSQGCLCVQVVCLSQHLHYCSVIREAEPH